MRILICFLLLGNIIFAQWSPVKTFNSTSPIQTINDFDFLNEQIGFAISYNSNYNTSTFYRITNSGITWDSTTTVNGLFRSIVMTTDSIIYAAGNVDVNLGTPNAYQSKQIYRSFDAGQTWNQHEIFNTLGLLDRNCMVFTNDSTGYISCYTGMYQTNDYGTSWNLINATSGQLPVNLGSEIATFYNNDVYLTNTSSLSSQTTMLDCYGIGGVGFTSSYGDTLIRTNDCNDGWGNTFRALTISELGGSTTIFHFLDEGISDVALNANGIFAVSQRPLRSTDGGQSFYKQECTLPSDSSLVFTRIEFINDDIAYALAVNQDSGIMKLLKTTNAGGITTNYVTQPLQNIGSVNELNVSSFQIFPNPVIDQINIPESLIQEYNHFRILSNEGKVIHQGQTTATLDVANLPAGNYTLLIESPTQKRFAKVLVVR
ncbi:MAG: T9SS type A sorting domain-containing protein [Flavobacteriales bacterium]